MMEMWTTDKKSWSGDIKRKWKDPRKMLLLHEQRLKSV